MPPMKINLHLYFQVVLPTKINSLENVIIYMKISRIAVHFFLLIFGRYLALLPSIETNTLK